MQQLSKTTNFDLFIDILADIICQYLESEETSAPLESCQPDEQHAPEAA